jgi:hypothetical protein
MKQGRNGPKLSQVRVLETVEILYSDQPTPGDPRAPR